MKTLEERKAEVFRRSENRIKAKRQRRSRMIACCIPLCLCIAILSAVYLPNAARFRDKNSVAENMSTADHSEGKAGFVYTSLEIINHNAPSGDTQKEADKATIEAVYTLIRSSFATEEAQQQKDANTPETPKHGSASNGAGTFKGGNAGNIQSEGATPDSVEGSSYTFIFSAENGEKTVYTLHGNLLYNESSGQESALTDSQLSELQKALGLELTWEEESK